MKILADANIVDVSALYEKHGDLRLMSGREISAADVADVDALLVRSITKINKALLAGSNVQFVATATSGTDHFDWPYLDKHGIAAVSAPGSNANAVVEFCLASFAELIHRKKFDLRGKTVGIVGYGNVGSRLYKALSSLGLDCKVCDPFLAQQCAEIQFHSLEDVLACSIISLHTPLTTSGPHPTYQMLNAERIDALAPGTLLVNAGRGELVDGAALKRRLQNKGDITTIIDCWETEPSIDRELLALVDIGTPHIAGYSIEAKRSASARNYASFLAHFALQDCTAGDAGNADRQVLLIDETAATEPMDLLAAVLRQAFPVRDIDTALRAADAGNGATVFDRIRKEISQRREFAHFDLDLTRLSAAQRTPELLRQLRALGFGLQGE